MSCTSTARLSTSSSKMIRHDPTRRRNNPWYSPLSAVTSPEKGSSFITLIAPLTRCRSRVGIARSERSAALASRKSQFILQVFQTDELAALELLSPACNGLYLVGFGITERKHLSTFGRKVAPQGFADEFGTGAVLPACGVIDFREHFFGKADRDHFCRHDSPHNSHVYPI
jgi:hypothetical protein